MPTVGCAEAEGWGSIGARPVQCKHLGISVSRPPCKKKSSSGEETTTQPSCCAQDSGGGSKGDEEEPTPPASHMPTCLHVNVVSRHARNRVRALANQSERGTAQCRLQTTLHAQKRGRVTANQSVRGVKRRQTMYLRRKASAAGSGSPSLLV